MIVQTRKMPPRKTYRSKKNLKNINEDQLDGKINEKEKALLNIRKSIVDK